MNLLIVMVFICSRICKAENILAIFVFGDSLVDSGNNNYIVSLSKANYLPNGIDFGRPTGRFTNGRTIVDLLGTELGLPDLIPPYLAPTTVGPVILHGVNFASGGGGILNATSRIFGGRLCMDVQLDSFAKTRQDIIKQIGFEAAMDLFRRSVISVAIGSNDFLDNYLLPKASPYEIKKEAPEVFVDTLIAKFTLQLTRLYDFGARKILVANVGPIGCTPYSIDNNPGSGEDCVSYSNQQAQLYNEKLRSLIEELNSSLRGSIFLYADVYRIMNDILEGYQTYGFGNANSACCYTAGRHGGLVPCGPTSRYCLNRSKYVFWDPYHPSQATNIIIAKRLLDGDPNDISPINVRQLTTI